MQERLANGDVKHISTNPLFNREGKIIGNQTCVTIFYYGCPNGVCQETDCISHTYVEDECGCDCENATDARDYDDGCTKRVTTTCEPNEEGCPTPVTTLSQSCPNFSPYIEVRKGMSFQEGCRYLLGEKRT